MSKPANPKNPQGIAPGDLVISSQRCDGAPGGVFKVESVKEYLEADDWEVRHGRHKVGDPMDWPQANIRQVMNSEYDVPYARRPWQDGICYLTKVDSSFVDGLEQTYAARIGRLRQLVAGNWAVANSIKVSP